MQSERNICVIIFVTPPHLLLYVICKALQNRRLEKKQKHDYLRELNSFNPELDSKSGATDQFCPPAPDQSRAHNIVSSNWF